MTRPALLLFIGLTGCECDPSPPLATLARRTGNVERQPENDAWTNATVGDAFVIGDAVRTQARATADLEMTHGAGLRMSENTVVRFARHRGAGGKLRLGVETGEAVVEAGTEDVWIDGELGAVRIERSSRVRVDAEGGLHIEVVTGAAVIERRGAPAETVRAGQQAAIAGAPPTRAGPPPAVRAAAPDAGVARPPSSSMEASVPADLSIAAGESPIIHDAGGATAVAIRFGAGCAGPGTVEVTGRGRVPAAHGETRAVVTLRSGVWTYRVRCPATSGGPSADAASGTITVRADTGAAPLAKRIAHNVLDADGRNYSVLYQNLLPSLTLRWSDAPPGSGFTLHLEAQSGGRGRVMRGGAASHTFSSGEVVEGRYRFWFESPSGVRSPTTQLRLGFDNATPAANLRDVAGAPAGAQRVSGVVEDGWVATVEGRAVALDGHNRFVTDLASDPSTGAAAIRLEKAGRGVHYYLRRPRPVSP